MGQFRLTLTKESKPVKRYNDVLLITGDGSNLVNDINEFLAWDVPHDVMAIGRSIKAYPEQIAHYADIDADEGKWVADNLHNNYPKKINGITVRHTLGVVDWFDAGWDLVGNPWPSDEVMWHGSTSFFAVLVGLELGYKRIVLAGCPLDSKGHWYFPDEDWGPKWTGETYQVWFEFTLDERKRKCRSMSGYTEILLGRPDKEFFDGFSKRLIAD